MQVLRNRSLLPVGGVFTPAAAFSALPDIFDELGRAGVHFEVVSVKETPFDEGA